MPSPPAKHKSSHRKRTCRKAYQPDRAHLMRDHRRYQCKACQPACNLAEFFHQCPHRICTAPERATKYLYYKRS